MRKVLNRINQLDQKKMFLLTLILLILSCVVRSIFSCYPKSIHVHPDEIRYLDISRSLFYGQGILVHHVAMNFDAILYPLFLAPFNVIQDQLLRVQAISIGNSILISSVLIPVYLIGKKIVERNSVVLLLLFSVAILPDLTTSVTFMSENLFFPLSAWLIYFVIQFWSCKKPSQKWLYCILAAVFCFLAYLTKVVAVYYMAGFLAALGFDCLFTKSQSVKKNVTYGLGFGIVAVGLILAYKVLIYVLLGANLASYDGNLRLSIYDFNTFIYFFYALLFNSMFALIAFFYFPVILPVARFSKLKSRDQNLLIFALVSMVVMIGIITVSISLNEDYPNLYMRQHTRYYAPLLILFLSLFYQQFFVYDEPLESDRLVPIIHRKPRLLFCCFTVFFCMLVFGLFHFFSNVCIDGVLVQAISSLGSSLADLTGDINKFAVQWQLILAKGAVVVVVLVFSVLLTKERTRKASAPIFVCLIVALSITNNFYAMKEFRSVYGDAPVLIDEAITINKYLQDCDSMGNVLVISDGYAPVLDTYIEGNAYYTTKSKITDLIAEEVDGAIDLTTQKIVSNYPFNEYDLSSVEYLVTDNSITLDETYYHKIDLTGVTDYNLYQSVDCTRLYVESVK